METWRSYFRNADGKVYHLTAKDWVSSGKAACGARIERPAFVAAKPEDVSRAGKRVCERCKGILRTRMARGDANVA